MVRPLGAALLLVGCTALPPPSAEMCASSPSPPILRVAQPAAETIRLVLIGDSGEKNEVSAEIFEAAGSLHPDAILLLGDNFYECGVDSPERWHDYDALVKFVIPIYPVLGNHDWGCPYGSGDPDEEIRHSDNVWRFPSRNYIVDFGDLLEAVFVDTSPVAYGWDTSDQILCFLRAAEVGGASAWRIVVGHHPLYSSGGHSVFFWDEPRRMRAFRPLLEMAGVNLYVSGHDHHLELVRKNDVRYLVSGSASRLRPALPMRRSMFRESSHGFAELEITRTTMRARFHRVDGTTSQWFTQ